MGKFVDIKKTEFKTLMKGDPGWYFNPDGAVKIPRASFSISPYCPEEWAEVIRVCISNEWLKPVAHVKESEFIWEQLGG